MIKIKIKDSKTLKDSIDALKKKFKDAEIDLTKEGIDSIANALLAKKDDISATSGFAGLRDLVREVVGKFNTPKSNEILRKVDEFDRLYQRDPRPGQRNDYWMWEKLLKYVWNIILKASGNPSPDVKEQKEDSCSMKDEMDEILELARLLGEAHDKLMEALDKCEELENEDKVGSSLRYAIEDVEADLSDLDFMGESDPKDALLQKYSPEIEDLPDEEESWDFDEESEED